MQSNAQNDVLKGVTDDELVEMDVRTLQCLLDDAGLAPALTGAIKAIRKRMTRARTTSSATTKDEAGAQQTAHAPPPTHLSPRVRQQHEVPVSVGGACATRCRATANAKTPSISAPFSRTSEVQSAHVTGGSSQLRDPGQAPGSTPTRQHTPAVVAPPKFVQSYTDLITICLVEIGACKVNRAPSPAADECVSPSSRTSRSLPWPTVLHHSTPNP